MLCPRASSLESHLLLMGKMFRYQPAGLARTPKEARILHGPGNCCLPDLMPTKEACRIWTAAQLAPCLTPDGEASRPVKLLSNRRPASSRSSAAGSGQRGRHSGRQAVPTLCFR